MNANKIHATASLQGKALLFFAGIAPQMSVKNTFGRFSRVSCTQVVGPQGAANTTKQSLVQKIRRNPHLTARCK